MTIELATLQVDCDDFCSDCRRCHTSKSRAIMWGDLAPKCILDGLDDEDFAVPCQNEHEGV